MKIKYKVLLVALVLFVVSVSIIAYVVNINLKQQTEAMVIERLEDQVLSAEALVNQFYEMGYTSEVAISHLKNMYYNDEAYPDNLTIKLSGTGFIFIMDSEGNNILHPALEGQNLIHDNEGFKTIYEEKNGVDKYISPKNGKWKVTVFSTNNAFNWTISSTAFKDDIIGTKVNDILKLILLYSIPSIILYIVLLIVFIQWLLKPLDYLIDKFKIATSGDISVRCSHQTKDEIGNLGQAFNGFMMNLEKLIGNVRGASHEVSAYSNAIENSITQAIDGDASKEINGIMYLKSQFDLTIDQIVEQASNTNMMVKAIDSLRVSGDTNRNEAIGIQQKNVHIMDGFESGIDALDDLANMIEVVVDKVDENSKIVSELNSYSIKINDILSAIESISEETSLLALNASIESARAGEAGKGFAVVAGEIRKLSENTNHETQKITALIQGIQAEVMAIMEKNEDLNQKVKTMSQISGQTKENLHVSKTSFTANNEKFNLMVQLLEKQSEDIMTLAKRLMLINEESNEIKTISHNNKAHIESLKVLLDNNHKIASGLEEVINTLQSSLNVFYSI